MSTIKAIETAYNGHRFRSRLEARWAVFFDSLGIRYEYEREGFEVDSKRWLPDFYLPDRDLYIEVKPRNIEEFNAEGYVRAVATLACFCIEKGADAATRSAVLLIGDPWPGNYSITGYLVGDSHDAPISGAWATGRRDARELWILGDFGACCINPITDDDRWPLLESTELDAAYTAARSARFERGESGHPSVHKKVPVSDVDEIAAYLRDEGAATVSTVAQALRMNTSRVRDVLYQLRDKGCVTRQMNNSFCYVNPNYGGTA